MQLRQSIEEFLEGDYEEPPEFNIDDMLPEEYHEECASTAGDCVLQAGRTLDPRNRDSRRDASDKFKSDRIKFIQENLPLNWMALVNHAADIIIPVSRMNAPLIVCARLPLTNDSVRDLVIHLRVVRRQVPS